MDALELFEHSRRLLQAGTPHALVTVVRAEAPTSAKPGDKAVVTADGQLQGWIGGGCAQPAVLRTVQRALAEGKGRLIRIAPSAEGEMRELGEVLEFGMACHSGGTLELFIDPVVPRAQLVVIGASPVAVSLAQLAPRVGFEVVVVAHGAQPSQFPDAREVFTDDAQATVSPGAWVVVATQGRRDVQGLRLALTLNARQVSFVASERKAEVLKASLRTAGADAAAVAAIVAPAGYPISASTPEEIALSVLAAVVASRRGGAVRAQPEPVLAPVPAQAEPGAALVEAPAASCCGGKIEPLPELPPVKSSCCGG